VAADKGGKPVSGFAHRPQQSKGVMLHKQAARALDSGTNPI
jgi:hypothetical protein